MTELENKVIKPLMNGGTIKFYCQYVDDTLLVVETHDVSRIHKLLNSFDKNLKYTSDLFENKVPHFLDLEMSQDGIPVYQTDTNTGLYVNYTSFVTWTHYTAWIRSLVTRALKICSNNKLSQELKSVKKFVSWNDFPRYIVNSIFRKTLQALQDKKEPNLTAKQKEPVIIYFCFPYYGDKGLQLLKSCIHKVKIKLNGKNDQPGVFKILYDVCKIEFFCNTKDRTPIINQSFVVYEFTCSGCSANYVRKTERTYERCVEHAWSDQNSIVKNHLNRCVEAQYLLNITSLAPALF